MSRVKRVAQALQKLYPKELADSSWDNTGLLVDAGFLNESTKTNVLLTIDLTSKVCQEAIDSKANMIVAYHPFIFRGLKKISPENPLQRSLMRLVHAGISVYSPHTAVDGAVGGVNDWLCDVVSGGSQFESQRTTLNPLNNECLHPDAGYGRMVRLKKGIPFEELVARVKERLGLAAVQVVIARDATPQTEINSVAVGAGSGASTLQDAAADVHLTGELGHHDMLLLKETNTFAIVCGHSNTERGFLPTLKKQLENELPDATISISKEDADPIEYM